MRKYCACAVFSSAVEAVWPHPTPSRAENLLINIYIYIYIYIVDAPLESEVEFRLNCLDSTRKHRTGALFSHNALEVTAQACSVATGRSKSLLEPTGRSKSLLELAFCSV